MKVGVFVTGACWPPEYHAVLSGHVQLPIMAAKLLADAGHRVTFITTKPRPGDTLPGGLPETVSVHIVEHASRGRPLMPDGRMLRSKAPQQFWQLLSYLKNDPFDVVHFFGGNRTGLLLACLQWAGVSSKAFFTPLKRPRVTSSNFHSLPLKVIFGRLDKVIAMTQYVRHGWEPLCGEGTCVTLYPGIVNDMFETLPNTRRDSVLFWRRGDYENGADLAAKSFQELAPRYPQFRFVFAVGHDNVGLVSLGSRVPNIDVHRYPYEKGVSIKNLLRSAIFAVHPFRSLSMNPQMAILETLYAGVPVITTRVESNDELIHEGDTGLVIPPNDERALTDAIALLLEDVALCERMAENARPRAIETWTWEIFQKGLLDLYDITDI